MQTCGVNRVDFDNDLARLQIVNDLLHVDARSNETHVVLVFVDAVPKHLLALFVDGVDVVQNDQFLFARNERAGLAKYLHVVSIELNALVLQAVQHHDVFGVVFRAIVFANNGIHQRRFAGTRITDDEQIQFVHLNEGLQQLHHERRQLFKLIKQSGLIFVYERVIHCHVVWLWLYGCISQWVLFITICDIMI